MSSEVTHMQTCGSGWAPRSPSPSRKPTSSCSPPSGDNNAIHINEEFAAGTIFKGRIAHGMLSASVISAAIEGEALVALPAPSPPEYLSPVAFEKRGFPCLGGLPRKAAAGQFNVSRDTRGIAAKSRTDGRLDPRLNEFGEQY